MGKILVTGGCGYIGSHIVLALSNAGESVIVFDNLTQGHKSALLNNEVLVEGDILDKNALTQVMKEHEIEVVIHLAALVNAAESVTKSDLYNQVNSTGSKNVWECAIETGVKHIIYASSAAVYGTPANSDPINESSATIPTNPYGESKLAGEKSLILLSTDKYNYLSFRFFNVGGAESEGRLGQSLESRAIMQRLYAHALKLDQSVTISGNDYDTPDGTVVRDFVHVQDIANAIILGIKYLRANQHSAIINLGGGVAHSIKEVITVVENIIGEPLNIIFGPRNAGDISYSLSDITTAKNILGWRPTKSLNNIVRDGFNSFKKRH
jgi:UDP-glucose 4-epimerase